MMSSPRLLIYINPHSGTKNALKTYKSVLEPRIRGRESQVLFTEFSGHCLAHVRDLDLVSITQIVTLSGDGLFFEAINGLYERKDWETVKERVLLGIIPCGTGNALACSMVRRRGETYRGDFGLDLALRNVLSERKGAEQGVQSLDLLEIELSVEKKKVLSFIGVTIGLIADADIGTESIRFLGHLRAYLMVQLMLRAERGWQKEQYNVWIPNGLNKTRVAWRICKPKTYRARISYLPLTIDLDSGRPLPPPKGSRLSLPNLENPDLPVEWVSETGDYYLIYADNLPLLDSITLIAPDSELDDGIISFVFVRAGMSRRDMLHWLYHAQSGNFIKKPEVVIIPVRAFRIEPIHPQGYLTVDGESFGFGPIQGQILPSEIKLMTDK